MPNIPVQNGGQDWGAVNVGRSSANTVAVPKNNRDLDRLKAVGKVVTEKKFGSGGNASAHSGAGLNAKKLEETDELKHVKVDKDLSKAIMQARTAKKLSQKELATKINEKPQVVGEYESGKAIPNPQIIGKIERALGCKLPRPTKKAAPKAAGTKPGIGGRTTGGGSGPVRGAGPPRKR